MIVPLPYKATHNTWVLVKSIDILFGVSARVTHSVQKLANDKWLDPITLLSEFFNPLDFRVHAAINVDRLRLLVTLVVDETCFIDALDIIIHGLVVSSVEGLVAQRPDDNTSVVLVTANHLSCAVDIGFGPLWTVRKGIVFETEHAMTFEVSFIQNPETKLVGDVVESRIVDLMRRANGIEVVALHGEQIMSHEFVWNRATMVRVMLMSVCATELDWLAVDAENAIDQACDSKSNSLSQTATLSVKEVENDGVQIRRLCSPLVRILDIQREFARSVDDLGVRDYAVAGMIKKLQLDAQGCARFQLDIECSIFELVIQISSDKEVGGMDLGKRVEIDIAEDAAQPPLVLILDVAAIAALIHLDSKHIFATKLDKLGHVKLARVSCTLGVAYFLAINPNGKGGIDALESEAELVAVKVVAHMEACDVATALILFVRDVGRVARPRIVKVGVVRALSVALQLPVARYTDVGETISVKVLAVEVAGSLERRFGNGKFPGTGETLDFGFGNVSCQGIFFLVVQVEMAPGIQRVAVDDLLGAPIRNTTRE